MDVQGYKIQMLIRDKFIIGVISITLFFLIMVIAILMINQMEERINVDCKEIDYNGIIKYWDFDIDCSNFNQDYQIVNGSLEKLKC